MGLKVMLINPPASIPKTWERACAIPLGLAYIAAVVEKEHKVTILDCVVEGYSKVIPINSEIVRYGLDWDEISGNIKKNSPDVVGISSMFSDQAINVYKICELVKTFDYQCITIMGGAHPSCAPEMAIADKNVDFIILGEGEETFPILLRHIEEDREPLDIDGVGYKDKNGRLVIHRKTKFIENLDTIPFPARHLLPMEKYFAIERQHGPTRRTPHTTMITSRGCAANCIFCSIHSVWGKKYRKRSAENVLAEIEKLVIESGIKEIHFEDDNLTFDRKRAESIFDGIIEKGWDIYWAVPNGIALWSMNKNLIVKMKRSGCYYLSIAIESGDQYVLNKLIQKPLELGKIKPLIKEFKKHKIIVRGLFVIGAPSETKEQIEKTINFACDMGLDEAQFNIMTPYPGTKLWQICKEKGLFKKSFQTEDLLLNKANINTLELSHKDITELQRKAMIKFNISQLHNPFFLLKKFLAVLVTILDSSRKRKEVIKKTKLYFKVLMGLK